MIFNVPELDESDLAVMGLDGIDDIAEDAHRALPFSDADVSPACAAGTAAPHGLRNSASN